jgi:vancomycin resistance protein YoaR
MRQKRIILAIIALLILAAIGGGSWYLVQVTNQKGYFTGVHIENVDLSGMTKEEAKEAFDIYWDSLLATEVEIVIGEDTETMTLESLGLTLTNTDILDQAYEVGREGNIFQRFIEIEKMKKTPKVLELSVELAADTEEAVLREKTESYEHKKKNAKIKRKKGKFVITDEVNGLAIDYDTSLAALADKVKNDWADRETFSFEMTIEVEEATYTAEMMSQITDKLGTYSTDYSSSASGRKANVAQGAKYINGTVIYPGKSFSVYETVAPFTSERGYALAGSYENGKTVQSMGGGICQVSTTLYNAVLRAELQVDERYPHSMTVSYVPRSADAAIAGTYKDLKFTNNTDTPIYIEGKTDGSTITFTIWGKETRAENREIEFVSETTSTTEPTVKKVEDSTMLEGTTKILEQGRTGYTAKLWKIVKVDGEQTEKVQVNSSTYASTTTKIAVGTKKKEEKKEEKKDTEEASTATTEETKQKTQEE